MSLFKTSTRYAIVGLICAAAHNAILLVADRWLIHYVASCVLSYVVVVVLGFALHVRFTFAQQPTWGAFQRYALSMAANYPITLVLLFLMRDRAGWPMAAAAPTATIVLFAWNYFASRWAIVGRQQASNANSSARST